MIVNNSKADNRSLAEQIGERYIQRIMSDVPSEDPLDGSETRPDGRPTSPQTRSLRVATRALRSHLDSLPIDYRLDVPADRFLAGRAFAFARQRYDLADSMIGAGFGGTALGSMARSLFVDGLRWFWIGEKPDRRRCLLGDLLIERNRVCILLETPGATCPILSRWLMPLPDVADLSGQSLAWLDSPSMPDEDQLLHRFVAKSGTALPSMPAQAGLLSRAAALLDMSGLRGAVMVLSHAGHGNHLGLLSSLTEDGAPGHDLRPDHEALFMHVAAVGVVATLLGTAAAVPELWPPDVGQEPFLAKAVELAENVTLSAVPIHKLTAISRTVIRQPSVKKSANDGKRAASAAVIRPGAVINADDLLPDVNSASAVIAQAETYYELVRTLQVRPWDYGEPALHAILTHGGGHSGIQTVMSTYDKPGSAIISVFVARMLLEEAARLQWRLSSPDEEAYKVRAKQYFDEYRARERKTVNLLTGRGVARADAERIFARPSNVRMVTPNDQIAKNRIRLPSITSMLRQMGAHYPEPRWLEVAYSLLSQVTHSTPIGLLHTIRFRDGVMHGNDISPEMLSLALDVTCLSSAHLIGWSAVLLTHEDPKSQQYYQSLHRQAGIVHDVARLGHGLD